MQFKEPLEKINNINQLNETIKILDMYYNRNITEKLLKETENELKQLNEPNNIKLEHEIFYNKRNELYNKLHLENFKLTDNENEITTTQTELIKELEPNNIIYLFDLYEIKDIETELFKNYEIDITSEYYLIINTETKKIYNLNSENIEQFINYILNYYDIKNNDNLLLEIYNNLTDYNEIIYNNQYDLINLLKTNKYKLVSYNIEDNYIIIDYIREKIKSVNYIDVEQTEILTKILNDNETIINLIIDNI